MPNKLLYTTYRNTYEQISKSDLDGSDAENIISSGLGDPMGIAHNSDDNKIYWCDQTDSNPGTNGNIERSSIDGSNREILLSTHKPWGIDIDVTAGYIFFTEEVRDIVCRMGIDIPNGENHSNRTDVEILFSGAASVSGPIGLKVDPSGNKLYILCRGNSSSTTTGTQIFRCDFDGSDVEQLNNVLGNWPTALALDVSGGKMYWTVALNPMVVRRSDLSGSGVETLINSTTYPAGIDLDLDDNKLYFVETNVLNGGEGTITRSNLDGTNTEVIHNDLQWPMGIRLFTETVASAATPSGIPTRIIHRLTKTSDYNPQLVGLFTDDVSSINIRIWDIGNGANTQVGITSSGCYNIGDTNNWGWSTLYLPSASGYNNYHYYYEMIANNGETDYGEFFLTVPERGRWIYP